ncbi:MAG TPA: NAD+ synthase [Methanoregula sp.]|nr:NAD+ synthase [Methanoregula sp.]
MAAELGCRMGQVEQMIRYAYWSSGCTGIVLGISGGVDSAVAAAFCCRAIGPDKVLGLLLPTKVSNPQDVKDAQELCAGLGMEHRLISIDPLLAAYQTLPGFVESPYLLGNLMARIRMTVLYYYANRDRRLVCGTSNRSEYMLGYSTKYGDNAADIQPILHLYKTDVYEMAREMKIPDQIITKIPSAGLWAGQSDEAEIGLSYAEIDAALKNLELNGWKAVSPAEEKVLERAQKNAHKRRATPSLLTVP